MDEFEKQVKKFKMEFDKETAVKTKSVFMEIHKNLSSSQINLLDNFL